MCGIAGVVSKEGEDVVPLLRGMLESIRHRGPDGAGITASGRISRGWSVEELEWDSMSGSAAMGHTRLAVVGGLVGLQPFVSDDGRIILLHNGEIYNYRDLRRSLEDRHKFETQTDSEVLAHLLAEHYDGDLFEAFNRIAPMLDGVYAVACTDGRSVVIARDLIGVRQLYWGENDELIAFASEKKALWRIGLMDEIRRLLPGEILCISQSGLRSARRSTDFLKPKGVTIRDFGEALKAYREVLVEAVRKRIAGLGRVGLILSGGVDSVLIAAIAKELGAELVGYVACTEEASDVDFARKAADQIGFPLRINYLDDQSILEFIPKVIATIEDRSLGQVEVGIPIMASVELAHEDGQIVLLTGQGTDELFGGYPWYRRIVELEGYEEFESRMWSDLNLLYKETLEREDKIAMAYGIELRVPYLDPEVIKVAFSIDPHLKICAPCDTLGKHIHRALASSLGVDPEIAWRPKEAAQHGAGIHERILALARKQGFEKRVAEEVGYHMEEDLEENLGSSQRYGFKYDDPERWAIQDYAQLWIDSIAYEHDLLSPAERDRIRPYLLRAALLRR